MDHQFTLDPVTDAAIAFYFSSPQISVKALYFVFKVNVMFYFAIAFIKRGCSFGKLNSLYILGMFSISNLDFDPVLK